MRLFAILAAMLTRYFFFKKGLCLFLILSLCALSTLCVNAQNTQLPERQKIDSVEIYIAQSKNDSLSQLHKLNQLLKGVRYSENLKDDTVKSKAFSNLSYAYFQHQDSIHFRQTNRIAIALAKKIKDSIALAEAHWDLGAFFQINSIPDSAYYSFSLSQKIYEAKGDITRSSRMLLSMAVQQEAVKDYMGSESNTVLAIQRLKPLNDYTNLKECYNQLGIVAKDLGEYDKAIDYYNESLFFANKLDPDGIDFLRVNNNIGIVYQSKKDFAKAVNNFRTITTTDNQKVKKSDVYALALNNLAFSKIKLKDTAGTKELIKESIRLKDSLGLHASLATSYTTLAEYHLFQRDTLAAIAAAHKAKAMALETSNNESILESLAFLMKIDRKNASDYGQTFVSLNDSLQNEERRTRNKFARIRFETDEFIAENIVLTEEKELLSKQKQIWIAVAALFFLLGLAVYIIIDQRSKNQKLRFQQQQQSNNQEIFNLMLAQKQKVDEVKRIEQKRISEELHDGVLGKMLGARMVLTGLNKKADLVAIKERSEAITALKQIENELRSISHELSHTAYQKINNFINSVDALLESTKEKTRINTIFNYDEDEDWDDLIGDIKINVYRIIQENIQNAIKHSGCTNFFINFEIKEDVFLVTIGDDGKGFDFNKETKGIGMRNVSSRIKKMSGTWHVDTAPKKGTIMKLTIPLQYSSIHTQSS